MRTAHSLKIDVAGHVPGEVGVRGALDARQRSIDHLDQYIPALQAHARTRRARKRIAASPSLRSSPRSPAYGTCPTMYLWDLFHNAETGRGAAQEADRDPLSAAHDDRRVDEKQGRPL